ncbi:unnamed protein product [Parnassius apollo]|uniref:(apollo) hypothetical protein n=1 Tax=Parnassius apollo TaxID=110799 RepID=A0A8S3YAN7_PARAO|nr:unnamed protein product [Parnassius apollo]
MENTKNLETTAVIENDELISDTLHEDKTYFDDLSKSTEQEENDERDVVELVGLQEEYENISENQEKLSQKEGSESVKTLIDKQIVDTNAIEVLRGSEEEMTEVKISPEAAGEQQEIVEEEENVLNEEPPPDPSAPLNLRDSKEALKEPFNLRPDQLAEVEQLWDFFQDYTPVYTDLDNFITKKELVYMLKSLLLMTYTSDQLQELIDFCVRPPHSEGHITFDQFLKIVTIRQRDIPIEEELRSALQALDPDETGLIDREFMKEVLTKQGHKMSPRLVNKLIKEVDISNDGTIAIEDVVGNMCIDLNKDDILMLLASLQPESNEKNEGDIF